MKSAISVIAAVTALATMAQPASAGPGVAYSWLSTNKTFDQCIAAANTMMDGLNLPKIQRTKFGVTGETTKDTIYVNCEDNRHVSIVLTRPARPAVGEIDALVALMQQLLESSGQ
jgi:hypothetical protein